MRRSSRRAYARAEKAEHDAILQSQASSVTTEQVVASTATQGNANDVHDEADEAFKEPTKQTHYMSQQVQALAEQADPAVGRHDQHNRSKEDQEQELPKCTQPPHP